MIMSKKFMLLCCLFLCSISQAVTNYWEVKDASGLIAAVSQLGWSGGKILVKNGDYQITDELVLNAKNTLIIEGSGWDASITKVGSGNLFKLINSGYVVIRNLELKSSQAESGSAIFMQDSSNCTIESCRITDFPDSGVYSTGHTSGNKIQDCTFMRNKKSQIYGNVMNDFFILNNIIGSDDSGVVPQFGIELDHSSAGTVSGNSVSSNNVGLKNGPGSSFNRIENNRFCLNKYQGILLGDIAGDWNGYNLITANIVQSNSQAQSGNYSAVEAHNSSQITFTDNQIYSWDASTVKYCVDINDGCSGWLIKKNILRNFATTQIYGTAGNNIIKENLD